MRSLLQRQTEPVLVYDHHQPAFEALCSELTPAERERLQLASSAKDVAERCDVTCLMVPGPPEMEAVCLGAEGIVAGLRPGSLFIDHVRPQAFLVDRLTLGVESR